MQINREPIVGGQIIWPRADEGLVTVIGYHSRNLGPDGRGFGRWERNTTCQPGVVPAGERHRVCQWIQGSSREIHPRTTGTVVPGSVVINGR